jgi:predicted transcriptional regulator
MRKPKRAIVLRLDENTVSRIDTVRHTMRMDRTTWLRRAVARHLAHNLEHELPLLDRREIQAALT